MSENLSLDSELLKPLKDNLEQSIGILTKNALMTKKEAEINLKISIGVTGRSNKEKQWLEPKFEYAFSEKIKEAKTSFKDDLGYNYSIELDDENNVLVKNMCEQEKLF